MKIESRGILPPRRGIRAFYALLRAGLFGGRLKSTQVQGIEAILAGWAARAPDLPPSALAYVLATAFHETGATMRPLRETGAKSDAQAVARLERAFAAGHLPSVKTPYWRPDRDGKSWFGRGLVQLTHKRNYRAMSGLVGVDLVAAPGLALQLDVSVAILIEGMCHGAFSGSRLAEHFDAAKADWQGARRIVNGRDRAALVAAHAIAFDKALQAL